MDEHREEREELAELERDEAADVREHDASQLFWEVVDDLNALGLKLYAAGCHE